MPGSDRYGDIAACTIVSKNYLSLARVWNASIRKHQPGIRTFVLIVDKIDGAFDRMAEDFEVIEAEELGIPGFLDMAFKYNIVELNTAVKPFLLEFLFQKDGVDRLFYFDPDTVVYAPLEKAVEALDENQIVLIPHILVPQKKDGLRPDEKDFLISGTYNLGFLALRRSPEVLSFLRWWQEKLADGCFSAPERGLFTDQKWIDLVPTIFHGVTVLKDRGYNVAYWNLQERMDLKESNGAYRFPECPLAFFHFSGLEIAYPQRVSKYQNRFRFHNLSETYRKIFLRYVEMIREAGFEETRSLPYAYETFDDGIKIPAYLRLLYYRQGAERDRWGNGNPFRTTGSNTFRDWILEPGEFGSTIPRLLENIYQSRHDVQAGIPRGGPEHAKALLNWAIQSTPKEYKLDAFFIDHFRKNLEEIERLEREEAIASEALDSEQAGSEVPGADRRPWFRFFVGKLLAEKIEHSRWRSRTLIASLRRSGAYDGEPRTAAKKGLQFVLTRPIYRKLRSLVWRYRLWISSPSSQDLFLRDLLDTRRNLSGRVSRTKSSATSLPRGVNLFGYFDTESGVGEIARSMAAMLAHEKIPHALINIGQEWLRRNDRRITRFSKSSPYAANLFMINADQVPHVLGRIGERARNGRINIGYWFWELSRFPSSSADAFDYFDEIWVASDFCLDAISSASPIPVVKVRPGFDFEVPPGRRLRPSFGIPADDFVFLYVFDSLSSVTRKNPAGLIRAFREAFPIPGKERLVLKTINSTPRRISALERLARGSRVEILSDYMDRHELLDLLNASDCYVSLHRSEGLGLTLLESMTLGKPVIATDYSGNEEFLRSGVGFPVGYRLVPLRRAIGPYEQGSVWADPDIADAAGQMRWVRGNPVEAARVGAAAREEVRRSWSVAASSQRLRERLNRLFESRSADNTRLTPGGSSPRHPL